MIATIQPSSIRGSVIAPASKSSMQRACAAALLFHGRTLISNPGDSDDDKAALRVIRALGAKVQHAAGQMIVYSQGINPVMKELNCGESGLGIRMFASITALSEKEILLRGEGSLLNRPLDFFERIFPPLGVKYTSNNGKLPIRITGPLKPADIEVDGSLSSQYLTGLLMAFSAAGAAGVTIRVTNLRSRPYIDLTLKVMKEFGMTVPENRNYEAFVFPPALQDRVRSEIEYTVEGDWSGAAFLLVGAAIAGEVQVDGLYNISNQADKKIIDALLDAGADVEVMNDKVIARKNKLDAFYFDATDCPDLFPPLVALASHCEGLTRIKGLKRLKHKESDRGLSLQEEFDKLSTRIELNDDEMLIYGDGGVFVKNHTLNSHHDHRIAMACSIASLRADFEVQVRNAEAVNKSYPRFYEDLQKLGASVSLTDNI